MTVDLGQHAIAELITTLTSDFDLRVPDAVRFAEETRVVPFVHRRSRFPLDIILAGPGLEEQFFAGTTEREIGGVRVPVVSAEDLVAMKVLAGRPTDLDDVAAVARAYRPGLDLTRVRATLRLLETSLDRRDLVSTLDRVIAGGPG